MRSLKCWVGVFASPILSTPSIPAVKLSQEVMNIISNHVRLTTGRLTLQYIDDSFCEKYPDSADQNPIRALYHRLGLYINEEKSVCGEELTFLGFILNFERSDVRIGRQAIEKTLDKLSSCYTIPGQIGLYIDLDVLESVLGSLNFLSQVTILGRTKLYHLKSLYNASYALGQKAILLTTPCYSEILHWRDYLLSPVMLPLSRSVSLYSEVTSDWTDSSLSRWAVKSYRDGKVTTKSGDFPVSVRGKGIFEKEAFSLYELIKELPAESQHIIRVDNSALVKSYKKGTCKNSYVNTLLCSMFLELQLKSTFVDLLWVNTHDMERYGADRLSRGKYDELYDPLSLTDRGANYLSHVYGRVNVDLFASIRHNPFKCSYHSNHRVLDDPLCANMDGLQRLGTGLAPDATYFCFPPPNLTHITLDLLQQLKMDENVGLILLFKSQYDGRVRTTFQDRKNFSSWLFQRAGKPAKFIGCKLSKNDIICYSFGRVGSVDSARLPVENFMCDAKRPRLQ